MGASSKIVLVTGGSSGIGKAISNHLSTCGYQVFGSSRKAKNGQKFENFTLVKMDVTQPESIQKAIEYIIVETGRIDVLINNAGLGMIGPLECTSQEEIREIFETNIFGVLNVCKAVLPIMRKNERGNIINITSIGGMVSLPYRGIYCSSKFAVEAFSEALSMEVRQFGIYVTIIEPGDFKTNINQNRRIAREAKDSIYQKEFERIMNQVNEEVSQAPTPEIIGKKIDKILRKKKPGLRYKVATPLQRLSVFLKRTLPNRWFEKLIMKHYKIRD